jgi:hypothetical protein
MPKLDEALVTYAAKPADDTLVNDPRVIAAKAQLDHVQKLANDAMAYTVRKLADVQQAMQSLLALCEEIKKERQLQ